VTSEIQTRLQAIAADTDTEDSFSVFDSTAFTGPSNNDLRRLSESVLSEMMDEVDDIVASTGSLMESIPSPRASRAMSAADSDVNADNAGNHEQLIYRKISSLTRNRHVFASPDNGDAQSQGKDSPSGEASPAGKNNDRTDWLMDTGGTWLEKVWDITASAIEGSNIFTDVGGMDETGTNPWTDVDSKESIMYTRLQAFKRSGGHGGSEQISRPSPTEKADSLLPVRYWRTNIRRERLISDYYHSPIGNGKSMNSPVTSTVRVHIRADTYVQSLFIPQRHKGTYDVQLYLANGCGIVFEFVGDGVPIVADFKSVSTQPNEYTPGPAEVCGLIEHGDLLVAIDEVYLSSKTLDEAATMISRLELFGEVREFYVFTC
jgi:hypothetical protein